MNVYQGFFNLKPGVKDIDFSKALKAYMEYLMAEGDLKSWRLLRRKLGLFSGMGGGGDAGNGSGEFHLLMEFDSLDGLDRAFSAVATRSGKVEELHANVNQCVDQISFSLYRDFPDPVRKEGEEVF
mmetsp:Transcript_18272/g.39547  ORF Transcript_18272/g.39547 Transcript_18272/m.39547 type:complete len:126 (+) Transcript_18272:42-419(+)